MEKLSSILPGSPRVKSVDLSDAQPRRPGSPAFGMPMGTTSGTRDRVRVSKPSIDDTPVYMNARDTKSAKIVNDISKGFFEKRLMPQEEAPTLASEAASDEMGQALAAKSPAVTAGPSAMFAPAMSNARPIETAPPRQQMEEPGRHIDVMA